MLVRKDGVLLVGVYERDRPVVTRKSVSTIGFVKYEVYCIEDGSKRYWIDLPYVNKFVELIGEEVELEYIGHVEDFDKTRWVVYRDGEQVLWIQEEIEGDVVYRIYGVQFVDGLEVYSKFSVVKKVGEWIVFKDWDWCGFNGYCNIKTGKVKYWIKSKVCLEKLVEAVETGRVEELEKLCKLNVDKIGRYKLFSVLVLNKVKLETVLKELEKDKVKEEIFKQLNNKK